MPTRFDTFDNSPINSEFRHEKLHQNEPSWISQQTQPQQPKIKFDNEPMNYDEFKSRYVCTKYNIVNLVVLWGQPIKLIQVFLLQNFVNIDGTTLFLFFSSPPLCAGFQ